MKIQVAIFKSKTELTELEKEINEFLLTINPLDFVDVKFIPGGDYNGYTQALVIYKISV